MKDQISLVIPVYNNRRSTEKLLLSITEEDHKNISEIIIIDNGSDTSVFDWGLDDIEQVNIIRNYKNIGVVEALQQGYEGSIGDIIVYIHNDVVFYEGFTKKLINAYKDESTGVVGLFGSRSFGTDDLYKMPYSVNHLVRGYNISGCHRMSSVHNFAPMENEKEKVVVVDGYFIAVCRRLLDEIGGFDSRDILDYYMYDNHLCLLSLEKNYINYVINVDAVHIGGLTSSKVGIDKYDEAHLYFYNYWKDKNLIPLKLK